MNKRTLKRAIGVSDGKTLTIAGAGFAMMALNLARSRMGPKYAHTEVYATRAEVFATPSDMYPVHREYYRILDKAALHFKNRCGDPECFCARPRL